MHLVDHHVAAGSNYYIFFPMVIFHASTSLWRRNRNFIENIGKIMDVLEVNKAEKIALYRGTYEVVALPSFSSDQFAALTNKVPAT